jgi:hypothetical protein
MVHARSRNLALSKRASVMTILVLVGFLGCSGESASPSDKAPPVELRSDTAWESEFDEMVSVLGLTSEESKYVRTAFEQREAEVGAWLKGGRGAELAQLEGQLKVAAESKNLSETKKIIAKAGPMRKELMGLINAHQANILGALTPERQVQWQGHEVAEKLLKLMASLALDATQRQYIQNGAVEAIAQARQAGQPNPKAAAFLELESWAENSVLSQAQQQAYQETKKKAPIRGLSF